jgi:hypothetical protein
MQIKMGRMGYDGKNALHFFRPSEATFVKSSYGSRQYLAEVSPKEIYPSFSPQKTTIFFSPKIILKRPLTVFAIFFNYNSKL